MKANIVQIGNSQGVRIPKALLEQLKFKKTVEFEVLPEGLLLRPVEETAAKPRGGWAEMFAAAIEEADEPEFADWNTPILSAFDHDEWR
jgi:antitoxin MazE